MSRFATTPGSLSAPLSAFRVCSSAPVELPLTSPLRVLPVGGGSEVTLCRGSRVAVRVVRLGSEPALFGVSFGGRAFLADPDALVAATDAVLPPVSALAPAPAPVVSPGDAAAAARAAGAHQAGFFAPRRRVGGAATAPVFAGASPRRARPAGRPSDGVRASLDAHVRRNRGLS